MGTVQLALSYGTIEKTTDIAVAHYSVGFYSTAIAVLFKSVPWHHQTKILL